MTDTPIRRLRLAWTATLVGLFATSLPVAAQNPAAARTGDYIRAIVNQELVTAGEVDRRVAQIIAEAARGSAQLPPEAELRKQALDALIDERVIITRARDSGQRVDETEIDRAVQSVAAQNQITESELRQRMRNEGVDYGRFRDNLRDQIMMERMREREVSQRIRISDEEADAFLEKKRQEAGINAELNLAQILVTVADGADEAVVAQRRARAASALARVQAGEAFDAVARELSEDGNKAQGGEIGLRPLSRLPDIFVNATRGLASGQITPTLLRSGAGFHVLKVLDRREPSLERITQTRARHVLLRTSPQLSAEVAARRLSEYRRQIESGARSFEDIARQHSEDGSAAAGGDLGWANPGGMVPEFETALDALAVNGLSEPVVSRFGVHLIQVVDRRETALDIKQLREQARNVLREQKFEQAYIEWTQELRSRAYVEMREPPQ